MCENCVIFNKVNDKHIHIYDLMTANPNEENLKKIPQLIRVLGEFVVGGCWRKKGDPGNKRK